MQLRKHALNLLSLLLLAGLSPSAGAEAVVKGTVRTATGEIPRVAHVVRRWVDEANPTKVGPDGSFTLRLPGPGVCYLYVTSPNHEHTDLTLVLLDPEYEAQHGIEVRVTLARPDYLPDPATIKISGTWDQEQHPATRQADGTFIYDVETDADTIGYTVWGLTPERHSMNGSQSDRYAYDGEGYYYSVLDLSGGRARIVVDPAKMDRRQTVAAGVEFDPAHATQKTVQQIVAAYNEALGILHLRKYAATTGLQVPIPEDADARLETALRALDGWAEDPTEPDEVRHLALFLRQALYSEQQEPDSASRQVEQLLEILRIVPPESPLWSSFSSVLRNLYQAPQEYAASKAQLLRIFDAAGDPETRVVLLDQLLTLARFTDHDQDFEHFYAQLKKDYGDSPVAESILMRFNPDPPLAPGKPLPDFTAERFSGARFDTRDYRGHVLILDFWATWCTPCVAAIPDLEKLWADYSGRGLKMVSIALEPSPESVKAFLRASGREMPWEHAILPEGWQSPVMKQLGILGVPNLVLVDADGRVVQSYGIPADLRVELDRLLPDGEE